MREDIAGPETPQSPFPIKVKGTVSKGYGRGSKELGIPTANLPEDVAESMKDVLQTGIYFGYANVSSGKVYPCALSFGWNPFYKNTKRSAEVHIIHQFDHDFYDEELKVIILGYIRPELNYTTLEALKQDILKDLEVTVKSLSRPQYSLYSQDAFFSF